MKAVLVAAMTLVIAAPAQSQIRLYGGKYDRPDNAFAGVGYEIGVLPIIDVIPNYEYVFTSVGHFSSFNVDGVINFLVVGFAGLGVGVNFTDSDAGGTGAAWNVLAGISLDKVPLSPFLQAKYVAYSEGGNTWLIGAGIRL
jgi:hypothetical protein